MTTTQATKTINFENVGFLENLQNAAFSNDLLAIRSSTEHFWVAIESIQKEDGSANGYNIQGVIMLSESYPKYTKVKGYFKYYDRSKAGTGYVSIES